MSTVRFAGPTPYTARFEDAWPPPFRLANLGHRLALIAPSLRFTIPNHAYCHQSQRLSHALISKFTQIRRGFSKHDSGLNQSMFAHLY